MESRPQQAPDPATSAAVDRLGPDERNKVQRIGSQARGLFGDFTSWIELRLRLFQVEIQDRIRTKIDEAVIKAAPIVAAVLAGLFALVTIALFVGWALGHPAWGFLVVTVLLLFVTGLLYARSRRLGRDAREVEIARSSTNREG